MLHSKPAALRILDKLAAFKQSGNAAYVPTLNNITRLCAALQQPQQQFRSIHVAGTNGKGSVCHLLSAILQSAGYKTGLYTTPHLRHWREEIKINAQMVDEDFTAAILQQLEPEIDTLQPSQFEVMTALAFAYFARNKVDIAVIETGLGGLHDSTNIIQPELSIITNIGFDHQALLGNTLAEIATQKAGIIKPGIPALIGEVLPETRSVFEKTAQQQNSPLFFGEEMLTVSRAGDGKNGLLIHAVQNGKTDAYHCGFGGSCQLQNVRTVLAALSILQEHGFNLTQTHIAAGLANAVALTGWQGRWESIRRLPEIILDGAHNTEGFRQLLPELAAGNGNWHIVLGIGADKPVANMLSLLPKTARYYFTTAQHSARALPAAELQTLAAVWGLFGKTFENVNAAVKAALNVAKAADRILVTGSLYLVGEVDNTQFT